MRKTVSLAVAALALAAPSLAAAQPGDFPTPVAASAPAEPGAIPLYAPSHGMPPAENWALYFGKDYAVRNVTVPTLTPVLPDPAKATGAAVIVAPGGAFMGLSMTQEGGNVARALADRGVAAFVLKYRLLPTPADEQESGRYVWGKMMEGLPDPTKMPTLQNPQSTEDGIAALAMVRGGAAKWGIDPARVGMIGFSAGAMTSLNTTLAARSGERSAFVGYIYGPQARIEVPADAPPLFDAIALDDPLFPSMGFPIAQAWLAAKRPVEIHGYQKGSHGFGLGMPGTTTTQMLDQFVGWLDMQGFLKPKVAR
jgi:acetyl esterase/lipase